MRGRSLVILLAVLAVAVALENFIFFSGAGSDFEGVDDELEEALGSDAIDEDAEPLAPIEPPLLAAWLSEQPGPGRSPFLTRAEAGQVGGSALAGLPHLSATLWSAGRRVAWIDGSPRSEGDFVGEHEIESIEPKAVVLRRGEALVRLELGAVRAPRAPEEWDDDAD